MAEDKRKLAKDLDRARTGRKRGEDLSHMVFGKLPPQNLPLEEVVLGSIMLDKEALTNVIDVLQPETFYKDAHQHIYRAMRRLFERSQPIDMITVREELLKAGELEAVGGTTYLVELTNKVASSANIEYHARILSQKWIQRELIRISNDTIRDAYEDTIDVFDLLDNAEQGLFQIAEHNMGRRIDSMGSLSHRLLEELEELKNRKDGLTGIPSGFTELDRLTSGLQRSDFIIIAGRPAMGKTSFALSLAKNAAIDFEKAIAIFSLEMSSLQLATRIVSMDAEIEGSKMRSGQLEEAEWEALNRSIDKIGDAPIFIDDTPGINIFELRAKCRRLKLQHDIQLVVIDYLQLMTGGKENTKGNREQEVGAISRALKGLAKELDVPVIALAQLSRAVEVRGGNKKPMLSDLRESGCLTGDARLQRADTGAIVTIKELADREEQTPVPVFAMGENQKIEPHWLTKAFPSGKKPVFELVTRSGRRIKASANHPFRKFTDWARLDELQIGDLIAVPRVVRPTAPSVNLTDEHLALLAHLIGDGCILPRQPYHYTSCDPQNIQVVEDSAKKLFGIECRRVPQDSYWHTYLKSPYHLTHGKRHPITDWFDTLGINRVRSYRKEIPAAVFSCSVPKIRFFLHHLWATDGNVSVKQLRNRKPNAAIYYATTSSTLASQVQHLLIQCGILSTVGRVKQGRHRDSYHVRISGKNEQLKFLQEIGCYGSRGAIIPQLIEDINDIDTNTNLDIIPATVWEQMVKPKMREAGLTQRQICKQFGIAHAGNVFSGNISRSRLKQFADVLSSDPDLMATAESDLYWDQVVEIIPLGEEETYDATVPGVHNFVANNIVVHNSIEQDADIVCFLYRPEYYQIMEDEEGNSNKGVAEVIVAKHRHGATDTIRLRFIDKFARFGNLDDMNFDELPGGTFDTGFNPNITLPSKINDDEDIPF